VLFGGVDTYETAASDETGASTLAPSSGRSVIREWPPARAHGTTFAYSNEDETVVLFGGGADRMSFTDETWLYNTRRDMHFRGPRATQGHRGPSRATLSRFDGSRSRQLSCSEASRTSSPSTTLRQPHSAACRSPS